jgi:hypothetical protein
MTSLPAALVRYRADLEEAIAREQTVGLRRSRRRRRIGVVAAAIVVVGTASAFAGAKYLSEDPWTARGKLSRTVDGVDFSFTVPSHKLPYYEPDFGWENGPAEKVGDEFRFRNFLISASLDPGQAAEAVFYWTAFPDGGEATPCSRLLGSAIGPSTADLAAAMAKASGTKLIRRPTQATVGGRPATYLVLRVRKDFGCDPGFFFGWRPIELSEQWGTFWNRTRAGDRIRVWIVDVGGKRLVFVAETRESGFRTADFYHPPPYQPDLRKVRRDITEIVASIRFD